MQTEPLAAWADGSVKWLLVTFILPESLGDPPSVQLRPVESTAEADPGDALGTIRARSEGEGVTIKNRNGSFRITRGEDRLFGEIGELSKWLSTQGCRLLFTDSQGRETPARVETVRLDESGPVRVQVTLGGSLSPRTGLRFSGDLSFYAGSNLIRLRITVENPNRARHPDGYWDLGDPGSVLFRDLSVEIATLAPGGGQIYWLEEPHGRPRSSIGGALEIYQDSSGGENWRSRNHVNREGAVPVRFRGFRIRSREEETHGLRANPTASLCWKEKSVTLALEEFWQQFPSAIEADGNRLRVRLHPGQFGDLHELQGGEHNTRTVWIELGSGDGVAACRHLSWIHDPPVLVPEPAETAASGVLPFFPLPEATCRNDLMSLLEAALAGERSFFAKREAIDEFGWRHFGEMWADHEEAHSPDPAPVISHYNNQYDVLHSVLVQFLATGDQRWWKLADPMARHLMDIDIYHTRWDKPAFNGGYFWHTAHYHDAGTCSHRSMSTTMKDKGNPAGGGGPGNEHNYTSGLLLYHYLTGSRQARRSVIGLADWVIAMDDGKRHIFGILSDRPTGDASRTGAPDYHGPGRGAGNSINALLDGWLATGHVKYLHKLEELVRRSIHPCDDVESRDLGNAEQRWSYTVHLQALVRFLELTRSQPRLGELRVYVRAALLRYGQWMVENERYYLDEPEKLEYPTETWAAQELRKGTTLWMLARYAQPGDRKRFRKRGSELLDRAWQGLSSFDSKVCTRPLALVLQQGYLETSLTTEETSPDRAASTGDGAEAARSFGSAREFVDQRQHVRNLAVSPWRLPASLWHGLRPSRWFNLIKRSWAFERLRRWSEILRVD